MTIDRKPRWEDLRADAALLKESEPLLSSLAECLAGSATFGEALGKIMALEFSGLGVDAGDIATLIADHMDRQNTDAAFADLDATLSRDPAAGQSLSVVLFYKGYLALQNYRVAHNLWNQGRGMLARFLQAAAAKRWAIDIHPAARMGQGIMIDHGHGIVIGETAALGDHVSILHGVTLGGTGKETGDRHPKIARGVMIGAGSTILGNINIGEGARIAAGSVVLQPVPPHVTVAGVPARIIGKAGSDDPATTMDQTGGIT